MGGTLDCNSADPKEETKCPSTRPVSRKNTTTSASSGESLPGQLTATGKVDAQQDYRAAEDLVRREALAEE